MNLSSSQITGFQRTILEYYKKQGRTLPWRTTTDPYHIVVSEIMLQQTQVDRVIDKYNNFISVFPTLESLADASLHTLLMHWKGLGYNRRALNLKRLAEVVIKDFKGKIPSGPDILDSLPGIGPATAASIAAFAFNKPTVFIETNIRTVFIHFFYKDTITLVDDGNIKALVEQTLYKRNPSRWYNALMDYGTMLKKQHPNPGRKSAHYSTQKSFIGSDRQIRGKILGALLENNGMSLSSLAGKVVADKPRLESIVEELICDGLIVRRGRSYFIPA